MLDVVHDRNLRVSGQHEVAVHAVYCEVRWDGALGCGEALCDYGTTIDAACSWGMPERSGVGVEVLVAWS
jgi:hypothetical protein